MTNIAIFGLGIAGNARIKAVEQNPQLNLAAICSRRAINKAISFEQALSNPEIHAVIISTENTHHQQAVEQALMAKKHVLCEYPLCFSQQKADYFFNLAKQNNLILHCGFIALLTQSHQQLKNQLTNQLVTNGHYQFTGGWNEKIANIDLQGPLQFLCVSRLMQIADWLGPFKIEKNQITQNNQQAIISLNLVFNNNKKILFEEIRRPQLKRNRQFHLELNTETIDWHFKPQKENLFYQDTEYFLKRIQHNQPAYYNEDFLIDLIGQLESLTIV